MSLPLIGLTTYALNSRGYFELPAGYLESMFRAGAAPILLAPVDNGTLATAWLERLDGLVLTGGDDLDPKLYGGNAHPAVDGVDPARDSSEIKLTQYALDRGIPMLAICRGLQVLNVVLGGTLHEHLPDAIGERVAHRAPDREATRHPCSIEPESRIRGILGVAVTDTVSWHHQGIKTLAPGLRPAAYASDGLIEAVELPDHPWCIGVQWHPEMSAAEDPVQQRLFDEFAKAACRR